MSLLCSCNSFSEYYGSKAQVSFSRDEAIKNGVFIKAYKPVNNKVILPNSDIVNIKDAWIERVWHLSLIHISSRNVPVYKLHVIARRVFAYLAEGHTPALECGVVFPCKYVITQPSGFNLYLSYTFQYFCRCKHLIRRVFSDDKCNRSEISNTDVYKRQA